jgi:hypothetical protein
MATSNTARDPSTKLFTRSVPLGCVLGIAIVVAFCLLPSPAVRAQLQSAGDSPSATKDRLNGQGWWPTKSSAPPESFMGDSSCAGCHSKKSTSQPGTPMGQAAMRVPGRAPSPQIVPATLELGPYLYRVSSDHLGSRLSVSSAGKSITANITWIFGEGVHGQTYILENDGAFYESQVSTFAALHGMDLTPGHVLLAAGDLTNALGDRLSASAAAHCFACHTTYSSTGSKFDPARAIPGIHCEACHGPGSAHVAAMRDDRTAEASTTIFDPKHLSPVGSVDFCGACHRTTVDVVESTEAYGPINVRFQPYRLEKSRCWGTQGDARLTCTACHDPHEPFAHNAGYYDQKCVACHAARNGASSAQGSSPAVCPVATANCVSCHMPKSDVPGMHAKFTDHFIRIIRSGESYPN